MKVKKLSYSDISRIYILLALDSQKHLKEVNTGLYIFERFKQYKKVIKISRVLSVEYKMKLTSKRHTIGSWKIKY